MNSLRSQPRQRSSSSISASWAIRSSSEGGDVAVRATDMSDLVAVEREVVRDEYLAATVDVLVETEVVVGPGEWSNCLSGR